MARSARAAVAGVCYHVFNRGNDRKTIFAEGADFDRFLALVAQASGRCAVDVLAYCLMPNHFHFVVRPGDGGALAKWMHRLLTAHAQWHRLRYTTAGHIWQGRFKAFPIQHDEHLLTVLRYVERNAVRAGLVRAAQDWPWTSLRERVGLSVRSLLRASPCPLPADWPDYVNTAEGDGSLRTLRNCIGTGRPFGAAAWVDRTAEELGLKSTIRARGRPPKSGRPPGDVAPPNGLPQAALCAATKK